MIRRFVFAAAMVAALIIPARVRGHEGHLHKVMGTVSTLHEHHLEVKATDGKTSLITLDDKTKILRGTSRVKVDDIKPGERIVVTVQETKGKDGKSSARATEIRLGTTNTAAVK